MAKKTNTNWLDNTIGFFSPKRKLHRMRYRAATNIIQRKYEGAGKGRRFDGWNTTNNSVNAENEGSLFTLRNRSRDLVRNNPYATSGIDVLESMIVGSGIVGQINSKIRSKRKKQEIEEIWEAWTQTTACDYDGQHDFAGLQSLVTRSFAEGGDCIVRMRRTPRKIVFNPKSGNTIEVPPIALQILEGDHLDSNSISTRNLQNGNRLIQGVEFNNRSERVAYHVFKEHPGDFIATDFTTFDTVRIPANQILHVFETLRAGQVRGIPKLSNVILRLKDFDDYEDAQLVRQKIAAMYVAFVHDIEGLEEEPTETDCELGDKMEPGVIENLPPGKDVTLANPPGVTNYGEYTSQILHGIASGLGITYEALTNDYSRVNFSSGRMGWIKMHRNINKVRSKVLVQKFLNPCFEWFLNSLPLIGTEVTDTGIIWTPPRTEMLDPAKEIEAHKIAIRSGIETLSEVVRTMGRDPKRHFQEMQKDKEMLDELGLTLDTDPRNDPKSQSTV